ncbi:unnamed protein product [Zymoseptoria tritici ST99CH_1A5]|uniref:Uncharacterized protein n=1 Tax=Zymoseptoria tritici ST99CH_1A5 TaxID=1276529 RepID=A0A1Y6LTR4_ZYMTR|nr:unnamed protein product [Zymoseptoria tritici ST99CH_1A5]
MSVGAAVSAVAPTPVSRELKRVYLISSSIPPSSPLFFPPLQSSDYLLFSTSQSASTSSRQLDPLARSEFRLCSQLLQGQTTSEHPHLNMRFITLIAAIITLAVASSVLDGVVDLVTGIGWCGYRLVWWTRFGLLVGVGARSVAYR